MENLTALMESLANDAFEANCKIASLSLITDDGKVLYQTKNWNLTAQTSRILDVVHGRNDLLLNHISFTITRLDSTKWVGVNPGGMGSVLCLKYQSGVLVAYAMPGANPTHAVSFLDPYIDKINLLLK